MQTQPNAGGNAGDMTLDDLLLAVRLSRLSGEQIGELTATAGLDRQE